MARAQTTSYANYIAPGLRQIAFATLAGIPKEFRQLFRVLPPKPASNTGLHYFDDLQLSSLGTFVPKPEGQAVQYDVPIEGNTVRYTPYSFAKGFRMTHEMKADDLYGYFARMAQQLSIGAAHQMEVRAFKLLNDGFGTTGTLGLTAAGFDALALFNSAHTLLKGGVAPNTLFKRATRMSTDEDLSESALEHAVNTFHLWVNHSAMPDPKQPAVLVHGPNLTWQVRELLDTELKPYTGNNEVNPLRAEKLQSFLCHYLADDDSWFLLAPKSEMDCNVWMREEYTFDVGDDFDTGDSKAKGMFRMAVGHGEPDGVFGSQGA